jgi:hypothetical protein
MLRDDGRDMIGNTQATTAVFTEDLAKPAQILGIQSLGSGGQTEFD